MTLAKRADSLMRKMPRLVQAHFRCATDPYDAKSNPAGCINLGTAENHLLWDLLGPRLNAAAQLREADSHYGALHGTTGTRRAAAGLLSRASGAEVQADDLCLFSGASAALDALFWCLGDAGDGVLVPAPYYAGFDHDLVARGALKIVACDLDAEQGYPLTVDAIDAARRDAATRGVQCTAILLTNPNNPLGRTYDAAVIEEVAAYAAEHGLHLVVDELYAHSVFGKRAHASALGLDLPDVHVVYGLAKDLGLSGFKVGMLHTKDARLQEAAKQLAYLAPVSMPTQRLVRGILEDEAFTQEVLDANRTRLRAAYDVVAQSLDNHEIAYEPADAGIFVWADLRAHLGDPSFEAEADLHERFVAEGRVNLGPGGAFHSSQPGRFRICYAQDPLRVAAGIGRLAQTVQLTPT